MAQTATPITGAAASTARVPRMFSAAQSAAVAANTAMATDSPTVTWS